mgnify:CR=1 FL=1
MRIHKPLTKILGGSLKVDILRLFCRTGKEMSGREIARELKATAPTTNLALKELDEEGVLSMKVVGKMHLYSLNKNAWVTQGLLGPLFKEERNLSDKFIATVAQHVAQSPLKDDILSLSIFGSFARGEEGPVSDIDIFIIIKNNRSRGFVEELIFNLDKELFPKIGLSLEPHVNSKADFQKKYKASLPLIKEVMSTHQVVYGAALKDCL